MVSFDYIYGSLVEYICNGNAVDLIITASRDERSIKLYMDATNQDGSKSHRTYTEEVPDDGAQAE